MRSPAKPFALLAVVVVSTFALAQWHPFSPAAPAASSTARGDAARGETVFEESCAGCHGAGGVGGGVGPELAGRDLEPAAVEAKVVAGGGVMPANLVDGQKLADLVAYVDQITQQ